MSRLVVLLFPFFIHACFAADHPNVLFIAVDDLRPQLACYGKSGMQTPNIDRLAKQGVLFERAYCMVPTCGASRASLMTSVRPSPDRFTSYLAWAEKEAADALPLHTHFKNNGYTTISLGKVFHHKNDHAQGWTEPAWRSSRPGYQDRKSQQASIQENKTRWPEKRKHNALPYEMFDGDENNYPDVDCANVAIQRLEQFSKSPDQPFFLAVGFLKPHLPFNAPEKYWDLYEPGEIDLPANYHSPKDAPPGAVHNSGELRAYAGIHPSEPVDREMARKLIHGYYACVSFTDAQIGKLLDALEQYELADNTIVVLWGDHGWQLGEHGMWNKHSCFETSMHAPLIVKAPNTAIQPGTRSTALIEFIDIYPSLCELADLQIPSHVQGTSFRDLMQHPEKPGKPFAIGRFGAGDTIRSDQYRFSQYRDKSGKISGEMLYDHSADPDENVNIRAKVTSETQILADELNHRKGH